MTPRGAEPRLVRYDAVDPTEYGQYIDEWEALGDPLIPRSSAREGLSFDQMLAKWREGETDAAYATGFVPSTVFFLVRDTRILGSVSFRHTLNERLLQNGGHIGYGVRPSERRQGYATLMVKLLLAQRRGLGPERFLVTCDEDNLASRATIERCGGVLENKLEWGGTWTRRYWLPGFVDRPTRLKALRAEEKKFDDSMLAVVVNALLDNLAEHQQRYLTKNAVLAQFRITLKACRKAGDADKERLCGYLERVMDIQGVASSDGMLDNWLAGIPF